MTSRFAQPQPTHRLEMGLAFAFGCVALTAVSGPGRGPSPRRAKGRP
jgi:hypothetical protein